MPGWRLHATNINSQSEVETIPHKTKDLYFLSFFFTVTGFGVFLALRRVCWYTLPSITQE